LQQILRFTASLLSVVFIFGSRFTWNKSGLMRLQCDKSHRSPTQDRHQGVEDRTEARQQAARPGHRTSTASRQLLPCSSIAAIVAGCCAGVTCMWWINGNGSEAGTGPVPWPAVLVQRITTPHLLEQAISSDPALRARGRGAARAGWRGPARPTTLHGVSAVKRSRRKECVWLACGTGLPPLRTHRSVNFIFFLFVSVHKLRQSVIKRLSSRLWRSTFHAHTKKNWTLV
jgi:hypothetical protein